MAILPGGELDQDLLLIELIAMAQSFHSSSVMGPVVFHV
jgi:hypothetical protein